MKKSILKITVCICALVFFTNCSKDDDNQDNNDGRVSSDTFLRAKIDGVDFEIQDDFLLAVTTDVGGIRSTIMGATNEDESMGITFGLSNVNSIGTYTMLSGLEDEEEVLTSSYVSSIIYSEGDTGWFATNFIGRTSATVTITEFDGDYIIGTFSFIGFDIESQTEKNITNGEFKFKKLSV